MTVDLAKLNASVTPKTKAIMVPQLYGDAPDMDQLCDFCRTNGIYLIEDSAEAFGCQINNRMIGSWGVAASFSFFSNKTIATGEGGAVVTNDDGLAAKMRLLKSQNHIGGFIHPGPGFNYRMTNIHAAIGVAQLEDIDIILSKKKQIAEFYRNNLDGRVHRFMPRISSAEWMPIFRLPPNKEYKDFADYMTAHGIDTRPCFTPISKMPGWTWTARTQLDISEDVHQGAFNLPSYPDLTVDQLSYIVEKVNNFVV
jgi:perosamine synthetase